MTAAARQHCRALLVPLPVPLPLPLPLRLDDKILRLDVVADPAEPFQRAQPGKRQAGVPQGVGAAPHRALRAGEQQSAPADGLGGLLGG